MTSIPLQQIVEPTATPHAENEVPNNPTLTPRPNILLRLLGFRYQLRDDRDRHIRIRNCEFSIAKHIPIAKDKLN